MLSSRVTRRFFACLGAIAAPLLFAAACNIDVGVGGNDPLCTSHADCGPGELCLIDGTCSVACSSAPEICDGLDNDGDGVVDEGCNTVCMVDVECPPGFECVNGACSPLGQGGSGGATLCSPEICDGIDNDCNGVIDENCGPPCDADGSCPAGYQCLNGVCQSEQCVPSPEVCDGLDNDCNGMVDENCGPPCMTSAECPPEFQCVNGVCQPGQCTPTLEICDMIDNDCNGMIDDNCVPPCEADGTCQPCMVDADCPAGQLCSAAYVCVNVMP